VPQSTILDETRLSLDGELKELERLAVWIRGFRERHSLSEDVEFRLNLALEELFTNAVRHGGCKGIPDAVSMGLQMAGDDVAVEYADRGQPFDPADAPVPDLESPLEERRAGGLGLHFVRRIARHIEYHRVNGWNRITMRIAL